ncbi:MAG TPA: hypothetical protein VGD69_16320 [Herpetosiphonaceae bacterium]
MHKNMIRFAAAGIAAGLCLLGAILLLRQPSLPPGLAWPAERVTPAQAEVVSDSLVALVGELKADLDTNRGRGAAQIVQRWQGSLTNQPIDQHLSRLLTFLNDQDSLDIRRLTYLLGLAEDIDDLAEAGEITIRSQVNGSQVVILTENLSTGEIRSVELYP